ncbi:MAG TPA: hypothetical protein VK608_15060 [Edaphobacter sp.]|nr:hypothetical protein [Edaphobacter sp.]
MESGRTDCEGVGNHFAAGPSRLHLHHTVAETLDRDIEESIGRPQMTKYPA